jgi:hypothetical protein
MAAFLARRRLPVVRRALASNGLLVSIALFSTGGFCADPVLRPIVDPVIWGAAEAVTNKTAGKTVEKTVKQTVDKAV